MPSPVLIMPPTTEPISLDEAKKHLRIDFTDDDVLIGALIARARVASEGFLNRALLTQTWDLWLDCFPTKDYIELPMPPLKSVISVKYYGTDDTEYIMAAADYFVDDKSFLGKVSLNYGKTWPSTTLRPVNGVVVRYVAGYEDYAGTVNTVGTAVTWVSGDKFSTGWAADKVIVINSVAYSVVSVTSDTALMLKATAGNQSAVAYQANDVPQNVIWAMLLKIEMGYDADTKDTQRLKDSIRDLLSLWRVVPV